MIIDLRNKTQEEIIQILSSYGFAYPCKKKHNQKYGIKGTSGADANLFMDSLKKLLPHIPHEFLL